MHYLVPNNNHSHTHFVQRLWGNMWGNYSVHYKTSYFPQVIHLWNQLPGSVVEADTLDSFKAQPSRATLMYRPGICFRMSYVFVSSILFWFPQCTRYLWRVFRFLFLERKQDSWHLSKMFKVAFKDVSTKNSEPTYWTILFVQCNAKNLLHL